MFKKTRKLKRGFMIEPEEIFLDSLNALDFDQASHEGRLERALPASLLHKLMAFLALGLIFLFGRIFYLQVLRGEVLHAQAQRQSLLVSYAPSPNGNIIDNKGTVIAGNTISFDLIFYSSEFLRSGKPLAELRKKLSVILNEKEAELIADGFPENEQKLLPQTVFTRNIGADALAKIKAEYEALPGVFAEENFRRKYEGGEPFSNLIGYLGFAESEEQGVNPTRAFAGKLGLEREYDSVLRGVHGKKIMQVDASRSVQRIKTIEAAKAGSTLRLSIDFGLQKHAYEALARHIKANGKRAGALVALNPRNGSILALVSYPSFDGEVFQKKLSDYDYKNIFQNKDKPLFNRAVSGAYPPGSALKPIIASAALEENIISPEKRIFSAGFIKIPNPFKPGEYSTFKDWKPLGWMDIRSALAYSSNVYFYSVGGGYQEQAGLGAERIKQYEKLFGLGEKSGIDFPNEASGLIPDPLWKASQKPQDPIWRIGDTYNISIGQGDILATPLQAALYTAVFANGGVLYKPKIVKEIIDSETGAIIKNFAPEIIRSDFISERTIKIVREGMRMAVTEGSAHRLSNLSAAVAGKTGTAETGRLNEAHAWFTGFVPYENPEMVITVLVENGGEGSVIAVPIAEEVLGWYFSG